MSERRSLAVAGGAHLALLAALSLGWSAMQKPQPVPDAVSVDLLEISDTPKASAEAREATAPPPKPARLEPKPAPAPVPPPPAPSQPRVVPPEPQPKPTPRSEPHAVLPPEPAPDQLSEAPVPPPKPKRVARATPPKPAPDPDQIAKSLDAALAPKARPVKAKPRAQADPKQLASLLDSALAPAAARPMPGPAQTAQPAHAALDARAQASLVQAIRAQIIPCWNVPAGSEGMTVDLHIRLAKDGSVSGPVTISAQSGGANAAVARAFAESAKRAVSRCAPLKLPAALYDQWHNIDPLHFDPKDVT